MKLKSLTIKNFRAYKEETKINFDDLTTIIGKNDIGKSTILEALEIFFNNQTVKIDQTDANIHSAIKTVEIKCEFSDLPLEISIDTSSPTTLKDEYLLSKDETLVIKKVFDCSKKTPSVEIFIEALHPTDSEVANLLELKEKELQSIIKSKSLDSALKGNPLMRKAIWKSVDDLKMDIVDIPVSKPKEDAKRIWEQIDLYLPIFALFQSDRSSSDSDSEVQDPMKTAIATAIAEVQEDINKIQKKVQEKAVEIANNTHKALETIDKNLASRLDPKFTPPTPAKWNGLFSIQMDTDDGIPLNKRGSGVRRMILVSFFKAEAERRLKSTSKKNIIYALEEPETAQHPNNQKILIDSFKSLANESDCQIILTTHSPGLASELPIDSLRFVNKENIHKDLVVEFGEDIFHKVAETLGILPSLEKQPEEVKVFLCLEGPTDIAFFNNIAPLFEVDLINDPRIVAISLGGGTLGHWVTNNYLKKLNKQEVHIYDKDEDFKYQGFVDEVNNRGLNHFAVLTQKRELENYFHESIVIPSFKDNDGFEITIAIDDESDIPTTIAKLRHNQRSPEKIWEEQGKNYREKCCGHVKKYLSKNTSRQITIDILKSRNAFDEVNKWFEEIKNRLN